MTETPPFVPLWCSSAFSFLLGASHPAELVEQAVSLGCAGIALTDRDSLGGVVEAWQTTREQEGREPGGRTADGADLPLIVGAEVTVSRGDPSAAYALEPGAGWFRILLYATSREGYGNISELISRGRLRRPKGESLVTIAEVAELSDDVLLIWNEESGTRADLAALLPAFPGRAWVGISRHFRSRERRTEAVLCAAATKFDLPVVALPRVLYHDPSRREVQDVLTSIRQGTVLDDIADVLMPNTSYAVPSPRAVHQIYRDHPEWVAETRRIAERCMFSLGEIRYRYPSETRPDGMTDIGWLRELTRVGAAGRYPRKRHPDGPPREITSQLERELALIEELDYSGYFLTMAEIVEFCRREGIICQGRGSAANSIVCYCLGITAIDPVRMNLLFERFISRERAEPPDIDLDIEHHRREEVIQHVYRRYGRDRAAMVANIVRFRRRSAVREVGAAFGLSDITLDQMAKLLGHHEISLAEAAEQAGLDGTTPRVAAFLRVAEGVRGLPRHLSIHPGGFLLGRDPIARIVPLENAAMEDRTVIQWDKHGVEGMSLFKVDLLGLGALTHLDYAFRLLERHLDVSLNLAAIPMDVPRVYAMLRKADTVGVFQLESRAQMAMLPRLRPQEFYDLVVEISIVRPGPITGGMVHPYLRRRRGEEPVEYPHPELEPILAKTLGVPLFQEQVMKLAMVAADYTPGEADQLRRDMAAWRQTGRIEKHQTRIIERMVARGIEREFAERVFEQIRGFGEYGFPESHAASFSLIAYATAWVRAFYPAVFICALLNAWPMGFYSPAGIVSDARRHGVALRPMDVLNSEWECTLEERGRNGSGGGSSGSGGGAPGAGGGSPSAGGRTSAGGSTKTVAASHERGDGEAGGVGAPASPHAPGDSHLAVRIGLRFVKGLGKSDWERIRRVRAEEQWAGSGTAGLARFFRRCKLDRDTQVALAQAGALRSITVDRRSSVWEGIYNPVEDRAISHEAIMTCAEEATGDGATADDRREYALFINNLVDTAQVTFEVLPHAEEIAWDYLAGSHSTAAHPLEPYRGWLEERAYPAAATLARAAHDSRISVIGMVICRQRPSTAGGTVFMTLEDETGFINLIIWPDRFQKLRTVLLTGSFLGVRGTVQQAEGVVHVIVDEAWHPELPHPAVATVSRDFH
jgi:error-prone DNA polymerase